MQPSSSPLLFVRPTSKLVVINYMIAAIIAFGGYFVRGNPKLKYVDFALFAIAAGWALSTLARHASLLFTSLQCDGEKLSHEEGVLSKSTRSLNIGRVQDVRVDQSIGERIMGIGTLTLETAGESGRLTMANVDNPREVANRILALARNNQMSTRVTTGS